MIHRFKNTKSVLFYSMIVLTVLFVLALFVKGNPNDLNSKSTELGGPFEASNTNSRYALTEAIVENNTLFFDRDQARFSAPDMVEYNGKFFTIFAPGVSFFTVPFYYVGKMFEQPRLVSFLSTVIVATVNVMLLTMLGQKLGASKQSSALSALFFIFGSSALAYALTLTQHHLSVMLLLLSLCNYFSKRSLLRNISFGFLVGAGVLVDLPNLFVMMPVLIAVIGEHLSLSKAKDTVSLSLNTAIIGLVIGVIPLMYGYLLYNYSLTGSYFTIGQMIGRSNYFDTEEQKEEQRIRDALNTEEERFSLPFESREQQHGAYILLISDERGILFYSPVVLIGIIGLVLLYRDKKYAVASVVMFSVILTNIVVYSMFGDPWGGWAFGPRYLLPMIAVLALTSSVALEKYKKNILFSLGVFIVLAYSVYVNTAGAVTSNNIPPKVEAIHFETPVPYTYQFNFEKIEQGFSQSLLYNSVFSWMTVEEYHLLLVVLVLSLPTALLVYNFILSTRYTRR